MEYLKIHDWEEFQVYKDRPLKFIRVWNNILERYKFSKLSDSEFGQLVKLWLWAAKTGNEIVNDPSYLKSKIGMDEPPDLVKFIALGFLDGDGSVQKCTEVYETVPRLDKNREDKNKEKPAAPTPLPPKEKTETLADQLHASCQKIAALPKKQEKFSPWHWVMWCSRHRYHPTAIDHVLGVLAENWQDINNPWTYACKIIEKESGNFYERDRTRDVEKEKSEWNELIARLKAVHGKGA
jgi:hypothetical protein